MGGPSIPKLVPPPPPPDEFKPLLRELARDATDRQIKRGTGRAGLLDPRGTKPVGGRY
jgi:hypothetical protein